jgi:hypothetical protein
MPSATGIIEHDPPSAGESVEPGTVVQADRDEHCLLTFTHDPIPEPHRIVGDRKALAYL